MAQGAVECAVRHDPFVESSGDAEREQQWEKLASAANSSTAYTDAAQNRKRFSEVIGLCRTCENSFIQRRQYSEVPIVQCTYSKTVRVPLDIMECSGYRKDGTMSLRDIHEMGTLIDTRKKGGQYL